MRAFPTYQSTGMQWHVRIVSIALIVVITLAGIELYRVLNPQHYFYGYPMAHAEISAMNDGAYCVALDPYSRMCFSTEAEMNEYSDRRQAIQEDTTAFSTNLP